MSNNSVKVDPQLVKQLQQHFAPLYENVTQTLSPVEMAQLQKAYGFSQSRERQISEKERTANLEAFNLNLQAQSKAMGEQFVLNTQDKPVEERYRAWEQAQEALKRQYANLSEEQQNLALSAFNEVADVFAKADKDAGFFARTGDALSYIPSTLTKLGEQATGLVSPDGSARQWFKSATEEVESWRSDEAKLRALKSSDAMAAAKARGELGFTQFFDNAIDNPLETIGQFAESALPTIGAALVGTAAAPVTGGLSLGLPLAIGGLQGAGETRNQIYDHIMAMPEAQLAQNEQYQALTAQGFTSEQARAMLASSLKEHGGEVLATGVSSAVLSKLGGLGRIGQVGNGVMGSTAGKFASELVTEPMDEVFQQFMGNKAIRDIDKNHSLTDGLGEAAAGGLLFGAMGGGVAAADNIYRKPSESQVKQSQDDDIDNLTQSNNTDNNQAQPQAQPQTQPQNTATSVNEQALERVLADYQSQVEESTYEDVYDSLKADIRDGLIAERAKSNTQYGQFARDYLAQTGQGTQTTESTKGEDPSVENGNTQANAQVNAQAESAVENSTISEPTTETEQDLETKAEKALYSRSPMKSVEANVKRGRERMTQAITNKADVKRGMYNGEFGWVDFVWGDDGTTKPLGRNGEPVGRGIAHIFEARERKDGQSYQETSQMLVNDIVNTIAKGQVTSRTSSRIVLEYKDNPNALGHKAVLTKDKGYNGNAWVLTAFENDPTKGRKANSEGETKMGYDKLSPTQNTATLSRDGLGASEMHQPMNQSRGATTSDLRINSPIRSRTEMGAIGTNNVQQSTPQSNNQTEQNPEIEQAREVLRNALGEHADRITFVRTADFDLNNKKERVKAGAEGFYQNGKLYINLDNIHENEVQTKEERLIWVAWHELAHSGVDVRYKNVLSATMQIAQQHVVVSGIARRVKAEYQAEGLEIDDNKATEEALVELYAAQQTGNWAEIESRYKVKIHHSWKSEQGGLGKHLSRIAGIFKRLISAVTGKNLEGISDQQLFDILAGIKQGINDVANVQQNSTANSATTETRYSLNENADSEFARAVDAVASGGMTQQPIIDVGTTPDVLKMLGLPDTTVTISGAVLRKVMQGKHNVTPETLKQLPQQINNPVAVMKSSTQENGYVVLTELTENVEGVNKPVVAALHLKQSQQGLELINIASVYGRNNSQIQRGLENDLLYWNKEKGSQFVDAFGLQLPAKIASNDVSQFGENSDNLTLQLRSPLSENNPEKGTEFVNTFGLQLPAYASQEQSVGNNVKTEQDLRQYQAENSASNARFSRRQDLSKTAYDQAKSDGRTKLTFEQWKQVRSPEFKAWFGDWENDPENASKVINPKTGEPLVVYHGTTDAGFTEFDVADTRNEIVGAFFSEKAKVASSYSDSTKKVKLGKKSFDTDGDYQGDSSGIYPVFLNIKNPSKIDFKGRAWNEYAKDWVVYEVNTGKPLKAFYSHKDAENYSQQLFYQNKNNYVEKNKNSQDTDTLVKEAYGQGEYDGVYFTNVVDNGDYLNVGNAKSNNWVVFNPNQIKSATDNNGNFDPNNADIRFSRRAKTDPDYQRDLMVTHNISADGIMHANKMGGLPFASIAVTKQDNPLMGFGEVTLIGDRNYIDPKGENKAKVFGSDIYSPRYPQVEYDINPKKLADLNQELTEARTFFEERRAFYPDDFQTKHNPLSGHLMQYAFLKEKGIEVEKQYREIEQRDSSGKQEFDTAKAYYAVLEEMSSQLGFANSTALNMFLKQSSVNELSDFTDYLAKNEALMTQVYDKFAQAKLDNTPTLLNKKKRAEALLQSMKEQGVLKMAEIVHNRMVSASQLAKGELKFNDDVKIIRVFNSTDTITEVENALEKNGLTQQFEQYAKDRRNDLIDGEKLDNGEKRDGTRKYLPHTLENVVKKLKQDLRGGESFHYGIPSIRAKITPQFKSVADIQKNKSRLVTKAEFEQVKKEVEAELGELAKTLGVSSLDVNNVLGNAVDENIPQAFKYAGIEDSVVNRQAVATFLDKLKAMPTEYFEGKAKAVTQFSDFAGAVVPENLPKNAYDVLAKSGLKIYEYDPSNEASRAEVVKQATNELDEQREGTILFSRRARTNDEFANAVPKRTANSYDEARKIVSDLLGEPLVNRETRMVATLSKRSLDKLVSGKAVDKSSNLQDHLTAVANIDQLFENAMLGWIEPHKTQDPNISGVHRLFAPLNLNGQVKLVKLTVKEMNFNQGNRVYSVETIEVEKDNGNLSLSWKPELSENAKNTSQQIANIESLIQRIKDFNSSVENNDDETHYSRRQTVEELVSSGKAKAEPTVFDDLKAKDYKGFVQRVNKATGKVDEWVADALRPVNDWIDGLLKRGLSEYETEQLKGDMYRAKGVRDSINTELTQAYLKPIIKKVGEIAKAHKMDELTAKRMVGYWISGRYSIEKNRSLLRDELVAMREAKEALDKAIAENGDIESAEAVYRKAERQYRYRKHDVGLPLNSTADFKVGTAGGWSIAEAENFMRNIEKRIPRKKLEEVAELVYDLNQHRLDLDHHVGRYTEEQYQTYKKNRHYVPLTGDPNAEEDFDGISGAGQNAVNVSKDKALKGRKLSEAEDGIDASWRAINKSSTYAGWVDFKNRIDEIYETKVAELVEQGYSQRSAREEVEETLGITKSKMKGTTRSNDNVLIRKVGGVYYEYSLPTDVMTALKNDNVEHANSFLTLLSKPTSWYARGVTQWTITFAPMNMMRDTWEKSEFIRVQKLFDKNGKRLDDKTMDKIGRAVWKNAYLNKGVWKATKRMGFNQELRQTEENERLLKQLLELGGVSTYSTYFAKTETDLVKAVKTENSHLAKKLEQAGNLIEGYNKVFDTVSALSAYKAMIDNGVDPKQAAATTLELTNFRKTGSKMRGIKALYMFAQPTAMGARNLIKYLSTKKGQRRFVGYMVVMTSLYLALRAMDDKDEGGNVMDQLGDITRYIPLPLGDGKYFKFPVGFGMPQMAWNFSVNMVKEMVGDISFTEAGTNMAVHTTKTLAPVSPSEISAAKYPLQKLALTFTPTILQPLMQNVVNRSAFGNVITPNFVVDHKLKAEQSKSTTAQFWQDLALEIHDSFGFDMHPEQIKNLVEGYAPILGSLRELQTVFIENPNREQLGRRTRTPFVNQLIGTTNEFAIQSRYYEASEEAQAFAKSYKSRLERGVAEPLNSKEKMIVAWHDLNQRRMRELRTEKGKATKALNKGTITPSVYDARIKAYNKQMDGVQRVLLKRWREINGLNTN